MRLLSFILFLLPIAVIASESSKPNILFILTDDQRADTIHALGNQQIQTPNMDRLANRGVSFTRAAIQGSMVGAVCAPSRAMIHSGRSLFQLGEHGHDIDPAFETMPGWLRKHGYYTFHTGKWHNGREALYRSFDGGDRIYLGGMSNHYNTPLWSFDPEGAYPDEAAIRDPDRHTTDLFAETAADFIQNYDRNQPFYLSIAFMAPHDPRQAPDHYLDGYDASLLTLAPNQMPEHPFDNGELDIRDEWLEAYPRKPESIQQHLRDYYAMITHIDDALGRIFEAMEARGVLENTIIVFAGDNGLAIGRHGLMGKQNLYEHSIGVPLMLSGPGIPKGQKSDALVYLHDVFPTLMDAVGLAIPESVTAKSLWAHLNDPELPEPHEVTVHAYKNAQRAVRSERYKLISYLVNGQHHEQLFDLREDPSELVNLIGDPRYIDIKNKLRSDLEDELNAMGDPIFYHTKDWGLPVIESWLDKMKRRNPDRLERIRADCESAHK